MQVRPHPHQLKEVLVWKERVKINIFQPWPLVTTSSDVLDSAVLKDLSSPDHTLMILPDKDYELNIPII